VGVLVQVLAAVLALVLADDGPRSGTVEDGHAAASSHGM